MKNPARSRNTYFTNIYRSSVHDFLFLSIFSFFCCVFFFLLYLIFCLNKYIHEQGTARQGQTRVAVVVRWFVGRFLLFFCSSADDFTQGSPRSMAVELFRAVSYRETSGKKWSVYVRCFFPLEYTCECKDAVLDEREKLAVLSL